MSKTKYVVCNFSDKGVLMERKLGQSIKKYHKPTVGNEDQLLVMMDQLLVMMER